MKSWLSPHQKNKSMAGEKQEGILGSTGRHGRVSVNKRPFRKARFIKESPDLISSASVVYEPPFLKCPYGEELFIKNPFWDMIPILNHALDETRIEKKCRVYAKRHGYGHTVKGLNSIMRATRPGLAGILNCHQLSSFDQAVLFGDLYIWYVVVDDLLEFIQRGCKSWDTFYEYDRLLAKICFEGFGFHIGTPGHALDSKIPITPHEVQGVQQVIAGLKDIMRRTATFCTSDLQYLDLCKAIECYVGGNAFESLQRTPEFAILPEDGDLRRYGQMRPGSVGQAISYEMALILRNIYVPRHLRNTDIFRESWNAGIDFIWKANDLIGYPKDIKKGNPINSVNILRLQRNISTDDARTIYNRQVYEPAVERLRRALDSETLLDRMRSELITDCHEQKVIRDAMECIASICWASFQWNMTVKRYVP
jgi:hypothetical protein